MGQLFIRPGKGSQLRSSEKHLMQLETGCPTGSTNSPRPVHTAPPTHCPLPRGRGSFPGPGPEAELERDKALFLQAPEQGSVPGTSNAQAASEGETLSQVLFNKQGSEKGLRRPSGQLEGPLLPYQDCRSGTRLL